MGEMKSAWQIAMEKADKLGKASPDELNSIKFVPEGNKIASMYLIDDKMNLMSEITRVQSGGADKFVKKGVEEILIRNITLPHNEEDMRRTKKSLDGLRQIKENKKQLESIIGLINNLVNQYQLALQQTYSEFKKKAEATLQQASRNMHSPRNDQMPLEQKIQLQIQEEWRQIHTELDAQYDKALDEHRQKIRELA
jgi:hypothetical protein